MPFKFPVSSGQTVSGALDANGDFFPLDSLQQTITKDASGNTTIVATDGKNTWTQTIVTAGLVTTISLWNKV